MIKSPCKDCVERHIGCHNRCDNYRTYKTKLEKIRVNRNIEYVRDSLEQARVRSKKATRWARMKKGLG